jgi:hypothetical protein
VIWLSLAMAGGPGVALGVSHTANDPFQRVVGGELTAMWAFSPLFSVEGRLAWHPHRVTGMNGLARQLTSSLHITPDLSYPVGRAEVAGAFTPLRSSYGGWNGAGGVYVGAGVIQTRDDLGAIQMEDEATAMATEVEVHPTGLYGLTFEAMYGHVGFRVRTERLFYVETINSVVLESKRPRNIALEGVVRF